MIVLIVFGIWFIVGILIYGIGRGILNYLDEVNKDNYNWQSNETDRETAFIIGSIFWPLVPIFLICVAFCLLIMGLINLITKGTYSLIKNKNLFKWINSIKKGLFTCLNSIKH